MVQPVDGHHAGAALERIDQPRVDPMTGDVHGPRVQYAFRGQWFQAPRRQLGQLIRIGENGDVEAAGLIAAG